MIRYHPTWIHIIIFNINLYILKFPWHLCATFSIQAHKPWYPSLALAYLLIHLITNFISSYNANNLVM